MQFSECATYLERWSKLESLGKYPPSPSSKGVRPKILLKYFQPCRQYFQEFILLNISMKYLDNISKMLSNNGCIKNIYLYD